MHIPLHSVGKTLLFPAAAAAFFEDDEGHSAVRFDGQTTLVDETLADIHVLLADDAAERCERYRAVLQQLLGSAEWLLANPRSPHSEVVAHRMAAVAAIKAVLS